MDKAENRYILFSLASIAIITPFLVLNFPGIMGADSFEIVKTNSLQPELSKGSIILTDIPESSLDISEGDLITYKYSADSEAVGKIVQINRTQTLPSVKVRNSLRNPELTELISYSEITGKKTLSLPFLGYVLSWSSSLPGFLSMVLAPILAIIILELRKIY